MGKNLGQKLVLYGIGASAASVANPASADIVWSGPVEFTGNTIFYDMENVAPPSATADPANHDFELSLFLGKAKSFDGPSSETGDTEGETRGPNNLIYAFRLTAGDTIGSGGNFYASAYLQNQYPGSPPGLNLGDWNPGNRGFLGLSLTVGSDTFFGWADVTLNNLGGPNNDGFTLHSYAYENVAGTSIEAGAIPEPSTIALLVTGALGVLALKRRQK
jgi:hypothetical protein